MRIDRSGPPISKKKMLLLTGVLRRMPMGNVIISMSLPVKSIAADRLYEIGNDGGNVSAYIRGLIEDDVDQLLGLQVEALRASVRYLHACLAATGHVIEDFVPIGESSWEPIVEMKEDCE